MTSRGRRPPKDARGAEGAAAAPATPQGPERVLLFADAVQGDRREAAAERQELESWVTCGVGDEELALPVRQVQEILRVSALTRVPHAPYPVRGVTNMRGYVLPVVDLRLRLGLAPVEAGATHRIMVVSSKGRLIGLLVERVDQVVTIDRLRIEPPPEDVVTERSYYITGVYHHGEQLLILLDVDRVLQVRPVDDEALAGG